MCFDEQQICITQLLHLLREVNFAVIVFGVSVVDEDGITPFVAYSSCPPHILLELEKV